jgi:IS1 family transposase
MGCNPEEERWIWLSFDPVNKIILTAHLGDMTQKSSDEVVKQTSKVINEK